MILRTKLAQMVPPLTRSHIIGMREYSSCTGNQKNLWRKQIFGIRRYHEKRFQNYHSIAGSMNPSTNFLDLTRIFGYFSKSFKTEMGISTLEFTPSVPTMQNYATPQNRKTIPSTTLLKIYILITKTQFLLNKRATSGWDSTINQYFGLSSSIDNVKRIV